LHPFVKHETEDSRTGRLLGLPYDWRTPTLTRLQHRTWNPDVHRVFVPKSFGWGYTINLYEVGRRLRLLD